MQAKTQPAGEALTGFLARYEGLRARLPGRSDTRDAAAAVLRDKGLPTPKEEAWHFTNLRSFAGLSFQEPIGDTKAGAELSGRA
jgi:hypothetical protein